jgi:hypothetical protein
MSDFDNPTGPVFTATQLISSFLGGDLLTMLSTANSRVQLLSLELQQIQQTTSEVTLPMAVEMFRGTTSVGAGGATITPVNRDGYPNAKSAISTVLGPPSAGNSTASAERLHAGGTGVDSGRFCWEPCLPPNIGANDSFHIRTSTSLAASTVGIRMAMTLTFREIGKLPV